MVKDMTLTSKRPNAREIIEQLADETACMLLLIPESSQRGFMRGALEGLCDACSDECISITDDDKNFFVKTVVSRFCSMRSSAVSGNEKSVS